MNLDDFKKFVAKIAFIVPPKVHVVSPLPDIEVKVMSYILFAAKFLFCLDDYAENLSSRFAEKVNKYVLIINFLFIISYFFNHNWFRYKYFCKIS